VEREDVAERTDRTREKGREDVAERGGWSGKDVAERTRVDARGGEETVSERRANADAP
jgi:ClpP class serine protease